MRCVLFVVVLVGCVATPAELVPVTCDGDIVVCDGEAFCEGEDPHGDGPAYVACPRKYVACPRNGEPVCRQRIGLVDTERPGQVPRCLRRPEGGRSHS
ncbi:MAG: hypothetical protein MUE69_29135 [Myxococcota bacterium]|nr:hypothetical protein [Myxococcota bacterium]